MNLQQTQVTIDNALICHNIIRDHELHIKYLFIDLVLPTQEMNIFDCVHEIVSMLVKNKVLPPTMLNVVDERFVPDDLIPAMTEEASKLPVFNLTEVDLQWLQVLAEGWAAPLSGFMTEKQYLQCLHFSALLDDTWGQNYSLAVPIT